MLRPIRHVASESLTIGWDAGAGRLPSDRTAAVTELFHLHYTALVKMARFLEVLRRVDSSSGCSIKDIFASVDLTSEGFRLRLEAEWIYREPAQHQAEDAAGWSVVRTPGQLLAWGAAHGGGEVFRPELVSDSAVAIVVTHHGGGIAAGAIGHRSASVVGVSNLFTVTADADRAWAGAIAAISARFPDMPLVGYQDSAGLPAAHHAGFVSVGPLRVWLKD